jgi:surface antigen
MRASSNWATPGQCTWGALNKWYQSEGYYPGGWTGNAMAWSSGAASAGYTVSGTPRTRSILVMQPGVHGSSGVGHVAWVTGVNGNEVTIIEMNALAGAYNYNTRTLTDGPGMKYIYAP